MATYPTGPRARVLELGYLMVLQVLTVWSLGRASRRPDAPPGVAAGLRWFFFAWLLIFLSTIALPLTAVTQHTAFPIGPPDLGYLTAYAFFFIGLSRLPRAEPPLPGRLRILLDGAVFVVGVGAPLWLFTVRPAFAHGLNLGSFLASAYPTLAFLGVMGLNLVLLRCKPFPTRAAFHLLLVGLGISWLADLIFSLQIDNRAIFIGLKFWGNIINGLALILCLTGAWRFEHDPLPDHPIRPVSVSPVPIVTIMLVSLWLVRLVGRGLDGPALQGVLFGVLLLILVLLLRETLALRDSMRQGVEAATLALQARFEALVRHSTDPILVTDAHGRIVFADPAAARATGLTTDTLEGRELRSLLHPDDVQLGSDFLETLIQAPDTPCVQTVRVGPSEGPWRLLEISGCNLLADPAVRGLVLNARDTTERHRLENQLREAQKMEAVGRLAGGVAHDFNNLLSAIMGNLGLAEAALPDHHPVRKDLARIQGAATRGAALTGRLLAFCRREAPESKVVDPAALLRGVAPLLTGLVGERIQLRLEIAPEVGAITVDPNDLEQALLNLAANARDAMPQGGLLTIALRRSVPGDARASSHLRAAAPDRVTIEVRDTGLGMDEATQQHLFEPFFTTKGPGRGTGLGLASVYGMVKASHGGIDILSSPGQGTTIRLQFPRAQGEPEPAESAPPQVHAPGTETVLLVEDEAAVRETTQRILEAHGYTVLAASDAKEARLQLQRHPTGIHVLLTDVIMPGESGPALAADLVRTHPDLRVLYISGYTADELGPHGLARPDAPLLRKPFTIAQLTERLREVAEGPAGRI
ncbi:MAG TPA: ATP-binding protein [Geothrix sp.]|nr:ATP-binding protein [Geothrix sp.]